MTGVCPRTRQFAREVGARLEPRAPNHDFANRVHLTTDTEVGCTRFQQTVAKRTQLPADPVTKRLRTAQPTPAGVASPRNWLM